MRKADLEDVRLQPKDWLITYTRLDDSNEKRWAIKSNTYAAVAKAMSRLESILDGPAWTNASWALLGHKFYKLPDNMHVRTGIKAVRMEPLEDSKSEEVKATG